MEPQKTLNSQINLKKKQRREYHALTFQIILQSYNNQNSMVLAPKQTHRSIEQSIEPRNKPSLIWSINL